MTLREPRFWIGLVVGLGVAGVVTYLAWPPAHPAVENPKPEIAAANPETDELRKRTAELEKQVQELKDELVAAKLVKLFEGLNAHKLPREPQTESLRSQLEKMKEPRPLSLPILELPGVPVPLGTRATVTDYREGFVTLDIGLDAGLQPNSLLDIIRSAGGERFVGQVRVLPEGLRRKEAVGTFIPPGGRPISLLKMNELPRKGDKAETPR